jgi:hypothetical protein
MSDSTLHILSTWPGETNFERFTSLPDKLYTAKELPLKKMESVPQAWLHALYMVVNNQEVLARCSLYLNPHLRYHEQATACIGHFESINNAEVAGYLFREVTKIASQAGYTFVLGPMNGSTWESYRLPVSGSGPLFFLEPCYPAYYPSLFEKSGFEVIAGYVSQCDEDRNIHEDRIKEVQQHFESEGIRFRNLNIERYDEELRHMHAFCSEAFKRNFLYTPILKEDFLEKYARVKKYIQPEYVIIAEDGLGNMLGFIFCIPNYLNEHKKEIIVKTLAKHNSFRYGGMGNVLGSMFKQRALANGFTSIIHAFMYEENASKSLSQHFSGKVIRQYQLFGKEIQHEK